MNLAYLILPELIALVLARLIGGISLVPFGMMLVCIIICKEVCAARERTRSHLKHMLLASSGYLYEIGSIICIHTGCRTEKFCLLLLIFGFLFGSAAACIIRTLERNLKDSRKACILVVASVVLMIAAALVYRVAGSAKNGSYNWLELNGVSVQLSELYKPMLAVCFAIIMTKTKKQNIFWFYVVAAVACGMMTLFLKELGTAMVFAVSVLALGLLYADRNENRSCGGFLRSVTLPLIGSIVLTVGMLGVYCYSEYQVKHNPDIHFSTEQHVYQTENKDCDKYIYLYERTHSVSDQIIAAKSVLNVKKIVRLQAQYHPFHNAETKELISDYNFSVMCSTYGWLLPITGIGFFTYSLSRLLIDLRKNKTFSGRASQCCIVLFLTEMLFHIFGLFFLPFTGITFPFSSYGGSAFVCCSMMIGILYSTRFLRQEESEQLLSARRTHTQETEA